MTALARLEEAVNYGLEEIGDLRVGGIISEVAPSHYRIAGLSHFLKLGECVGLQHDGQMQLGEVVRIDPAGSTVKSFDATAAAGIGDRAFRIGPLHLSPDESWKGRVINALGRPIDGQGILLRGEHSRSIKSPPPLALHRARVKTPLRTGVRAIDLFMPLCAGQRIGVFAGSGVGKSTLLGMLAGAKGFSAVVVALVGERGRIRPPLSRPTRSSWFRPSTRRGSRRRSDSTRRRWWQPCERMARKRYSSRMPTP